MATSIPGSFAAQPAPVNYSAPASPAPVQKEAPTSAVKLSETAQIHSLQQQGQTPSQIANSLSIPVATVDSYLEIPVTEVTSAPKVG